MWWSKVAINDALVRSELPAVERELDEHNFEPVLFNGFIWFW